MKASLSKCASRLTALAFAFGVISCSEARNLGSSSPHGLLPVDERNPVLLFNDGVDDNWQGEYAVLLASNGGLKLTGIVVNTSRNLPMIETNIAGWRGLVDAAHATGLSDIPDPTASIGAKLARPASGQIEATIPNRSEGARLIVERSKALSLPYRPLVVITGGRLTDVADAYLMDPTVVDRTVIVSALGAATDSGADMVAPNGEFDPWADVIVVSRFRFVQVSAFYDQLLDVPASRFSELPANPLGQWIQSKQPKVWDRPNASDQVAVLAVAVPSFAVAVDRVSAAGSVAADATSGPALLSDAEGPAWLVRQCNAAEARERFWQAVRALPASAPAR